MLSFLTDAIHTQKVLLYPNFYWNMYVSRVKGITMNRSHITETLKTLNIRPDEIADERLAEAFRILLQLIEELSEENEKLKAEIQKLRDAINLLKGEQAKPDIKPSRKRPNEDISSEEERRLTPTAMSITSISSSLQFSLMISSAAASATSPSNTLYISGKDQVIGQQ